MSCVGRKHCAQISIAKENPRRLGRYRRRRRSPASAATSTLCACRVATRTANTVRSLMLDGSSKRACMRHHSSLHVAHQLPTSPCSPLSNTHGGFAAGVWPARALYPTCGKQKKLSYVYDMRHNFAFFLYLLFCKSPRPKMQDNALPRAEAGRSRPRRRGNGTHLRHSDILSGETAQARHLLGEQPDGAYYFLIRRHMHCLSPA